MRSQVTKGAIHRATLMQSVLIVVVALWGVASGSGCGGLLSGRKTGKIQSPNYPNNYPRNADCSWRITVAAGHKINLNIDQLQIEQSNNCRKDWLEVFDGASTAAKSIGKYCGSVIPSTLMSSTDRMLVRFRSNGAVQRKGFVATYNQTLVCGGQYLGMQGTITSPNYPGMHYPAGASCLYKIVVPAGHKIKLRFTDFLLEAATQDGTCFDDVQVFDGPTIQNASLGKFCGYQSPFTIHSTSNVMLVRFQSDASGNTKGFKAAYTAQVNPTNPVTTATTPTNPKACQSTEFRCDNGKCIDRRWTCDKHDDCGDGSDERGCPCITHQFTCTNGACVDVVYKCDGKDDCGDNSDEQKCGAVAPSRGCQDNNGGCEHTCTEFLANQRLTVRCSCNNGYKLQNDQKHCSDIDECTAGQMPNGGCHQICQNTPGSRKCLCYKGYFLTVNQVTCEDINECAINNGGCEHTCTNTAASYYCECRPGFKLQNDRKTCSDVNECSVNNGGCSHQCTNKDGSYECQCPKGYQMGNDSKTCTDADECATANGGCKFICKNNPGSFQCSCPVGYMEDYFDPTNCEDIDECMEGVPACFACTNTPGSYKCTCNDPGFTENANQTACVNINECAKNNGECGKHKCRDNYGSYRCECLSNGYQLDSRAKTCTDIDECAPNSGKGDCDHYCANTDGSYSCSCRDGYKLRSGKTCLDIDECAIQAHQCQHFCNNTDGSYTCTCKAGFFIAMDGHSCTTTKEPDCGLAPSAVEPTQVGWEGAKEASWPWTVLLYHSLFGEIDGCMGTLINRQWVITTADCVSIGQSPLDPNRIKVRLGVYRRSTRINPPELHHVKRIIIHDNFSAVLSKLTSNIALVQLSKPIVVTNDLRPVCLPTQHEIMRILQPGIVTIGVAITWGKDRDSRNQETLKQARVSVVHRQHCSWARRAFDPRRMICAGYATSSACVSDSGSPVMFSVTHPQASRKWVLGGVLSWGASNLRESCHKDYGYSAYTHIGLYLDWIRKHF